jgi:NAD(P) transhydrogenase subunit alpha
MDTVALVTVLVLASFTGYEVIAKVSTTLHTPLMSGSNAISGIILVGTVVIAGRADSPVLLGLALAAVVLATVNLVGGFVVTDRMLQMFRGRNTKAIDTESHR